MKDDQFVCLPISLVGKSNAYSINCFQMPVFQKLIFDLIGSWTCLLAQW